MSRSKLVSPITRLLVEWRCLFGQRVGQYYTYRRRVLLNLETKSPQFVVLRKHIFCIITIVYNFLLLLLVSETERVRNIRVFTVRYELIFYILYF
jgi:hypothetical protein